jgi:hypothetical protein
MIELSRHWRLKELDEGDYADGGHANVFVIFEYAGIPTVDFDEVDTAGVGRKMRVNSVVRNSLTNKYYTCHDATTGSAVWTELGSGGGGGSGGVAIWSTGVEFAVDQVIVYGDRFWKCTALHTSGATFDITKFSPLSEGVRKVTSAGHGLVVKDIVRPSGVGYVKAQADVDTNISNPPTIVWMVSGDSYIAVTGGVVPITGHGFTLDTVYYTSDVTAGEVLVTAPSVENAVFRVIDVNNIMMYWGGGGGGTSMKVNQPLNTAPSSGETGVILLPVLSASAFSTLPLNADTHQASDWEIATDAGFVTVVASSYSDAVNLESWTSDTSLATGVQHWWRVRYQGAGLGWSQWSDGTAFTTRTVVQPTGTSPTNGATGVSRTPDLAGSSFSTTPGGVDTHAMSDWEVATDIGFTSIVDSSYNDAVNLVAYSVPTVLPTSTQHYYRVRYKGTSLGWSAWSTAVGFTTGVVNQAVNSSPADLATGVGLGGPIVSSAFATTPVSSDTHLSSDWEVYSDAGTTLIRSAYDSASLTSWTITADLPITTQVWWRVRHKGTELGLGAWSALTSFTTLNISVATPSVTSPTEGATGTSRTPTITSSAFDTTPTGQDTHLHSDWEVSTDAGFVTVVASSYDDTVNKTSWVVGTALAINTLHYVRVRHAGTTYGDSTWSTGVSFTTANITVNAPTITAPTEGATVGKNPTITGSAFDTTPTGQDTHLHSDWEIATDAGFTTVVASSYDDTVNKLSWVSSTALTPTVTHYVRVRYAGTTYGDSAWSSVVSFEVTAGIQKIVSGTTDLTFQSWENYGKFVAIPTGTTTVVYGARESSGSPAKGVIGSFDFEAGTVNFFKTTYPSPGGFTTATDNVNGATYADGTLVTCGVISDTSNIYGHLTFVNSSGGIITRKHIQATAGYGSYIHNLSPNSAKTQIMATGYTVISGGNGTANMGSIMYSSSPSTGACIARCYYENGKSCVLANGPGCFTSDGNLVAVGYSYDATTLRATCIKADTSLNLQQVFRAYIGTLDSQYNTTVPSSTVANGVFCAGYASTASNGNTCMVSYFTTSHQWSKLYKLANDSNADYGYDMAETTNYVYVLLHSTIIPTGGYGILCLNKANGNVVWAMKNTNADEYVRAIDLKVIGSSLVVCGYTGGTYVPFIVSFNATTGAVDYVKEGRIEYPFKPSQIELLTDGYAILGEAEKDGIFGNVGVVKNPHDSPNFVNATWSYVSFTPYSPADTITVTTPTFTTYTPPIGTSQLPLTTPNTGWTVEDIPDYVAPPASKYLTNTGHNVSYPNTAYPGRACYNSDVVYTCGYHDPSLGYHVGRLGAINIATGSLHLAKRLYQSGVSTAQYFGYGGVAYADGVLCVASNPSIPGNATFHNSIEFVNPTTGVVNTLKYISSSSSSSWNHSVISNTAKTLVMATGYYNNTGVNSNPMGSIMYSSSPSTGACIARCYYESGKSCILNSGPGCFTSDGNLVAIGYSHDGTTNRATCIKVDTTLNIQQVFRLYVGSDSGQYHTTVPSSTVTNGVFCAGYTGTASNSTTGLVTYFTTSHQWSKLYKMANNSNSDEVQRILETGSYLFLVLVNNYSADGGYGIVCLNKSNGTVVWAKKTNRTDVYTPIRSMGIIGTDLIVAGNILGDNNAPFIASFDYATGALNYVKHGVYSTAVLPTEILPITGGFCLVSISSRMATIANPHTSADWYDATGIMTYVNFTPYSPADTITVSTPSFTTHTPTVGTLTVSTLDTGDTVQDLI